MYVTGEVMKSGKARLQQTTYSAWIKRNGKSVRVPLGIAYKAAAERKAAELQLKADRGEDDNGRAAKIAKHRDTRLAGFAQKLNAIHERLRQQRTILFAFSGLT